MKQMLIVLLLIIAVSILPWFSKPAGAANSYDNKPTPEEIIKKHLDSIGTPENRSTPGREIAGSTEVTFRSRGIAKGAGAAVLASDGTMSMLLMKFESTSYPYEKVGYDGHKVTAYQIRPGDYTSLGSFILASPEILSDGLMGGTLSTAWPLLDISNKKAKLEYAGTKKINSRDALEIRYRPSGGSDLKISLFFDAETYQHVRTTYKKEISAQMSRGQLGGTQRGTNGQRGAGTPGTSDRTGEMSAGQSATFYELTEDFSDFKSEGGVTLPHTYKIHFSQSGSATQVSDWVMTLVQFLFNQKIAAKDFDVGD